MPQRIVKTGTEDSPTHVTCWFNWQVPKKTPSDRNDQDRCLYEAQQNLFVARLRKWFGVTSGLPSDINKGVLLCWREGLNTPEQVSSKVLFCFVF